MWIRGVKLFEFFLITDLTFKKCLSNIDFIFREKEYIIFIFYFRTLVLKILQMCNFPEFQKLQN